MKKLFLTGLFFAASMASASSNYKQKIQQFEDATGHVISCSGIIQSEHCLAGLDKMLTIVGSDIFPSVNFEEISLVDYTSATNVFGLVNINAANSAAEMESVLRSQHNHWSDLKVKTAQFETTGTEIACSSIFNIDQCIWGIDNLLGLSTSGLFPSQKFKVVWLDRKFEDTDMHGYVSVDPFASLDTIRSFLEKQGH